MSKKIRLILFLCTAIVFLLVAPGIILYAIGFRATSTQQGIGQVGVLLVETIPKGVTLQVDGKETGNTPEAVPGLPAGNVKATLMKEGYTQWEKTLSIEPSRTTEVNRIRLFPSSPAREVIAKSTGTFNLSPNRSLLAIITEEKTLRITTQAGEDITLPIKLAQEPKQALWSPDSTALLVQYPDGNYELIDVNARLSAKQTLPTLTGATQVSWDARIPGRLFAIDASGFLFAYNTASENKEILLPGVKTFGLSARNIFAVTKNGIEKLTLQGQPSDTIALPAGKSIETLSVTPAGLIAVHFQDTSVAVLDKDDTFQEVTAHAEKVSWSPHGLILLLQTAHNELSVYNVDDERIRDIPLRKQHLIVRHSQTITHPQWFAGGTHLIYQVDGNIMITETDTRDHPISYIVDSPNTPDSNATVGENGDIIYYIKKDEAQNTALYGTTLLTEADQK